MVLISLSGFKNNGINIFFVKLLVNMDENVYPSLSRLSSDNYFRDLRVAIIPLCVCTVAIISDFNLFVIRIAPFVTEL